MGENRIPGAVIIEEGGASRVLRGELKLLEGVSAQGGVDQAKKEVPPYLDAFVFSTPAPDPAHPEKSLVYLFLADASLWNGQTDPARVRLFDANNVGTLTAVGSVRFEGMVDHRWSAPVKKVEVEVASAGGRPLTEDEKRLQEALAGLVSRRLNGQVAGYLQIREEIEGVVPELGELCWAIPRIDLDLVPDPDDRSAEAVRIKLTVKPAPSRLLLDGLPSPLRDEALHWLDQEMEKVFQDHPVIAAERIGAINERFEETWDPKKYTLRREETSQGTRWLYPPNVPRFGNPISDTMKGVAAGKSSDVVPAPAPGKGMPIPAFLFGRFEQWLRQRLAKEPGSHTIELVEGANDLIRIKILGGPNANFFISPESAGEISQTVPQIRSFVDELKGGTASWSVDRTNDFLDRFSLAFRAAGRELLSDYSGSLAPQPDGRVEIRPYNIPLLRPEWVHFSGDVDLPGIGGASALRKILGDRPMTRAELRERLQKVEERYHEAGYLLVGENPENAEGLQLEFKIVSETRIEVPIRVVRSGEVSIVGPVSDRTKKALSHSLDIQTGAPFREDSFQERAFRAMSDPRRLEIQSRDRPAYLLRPDGTMDLFWPVVGIEGMHGAGMSTNGERIFGNGQLTTPHQVPGLTDAGIGIQFGGLDFFGTQIFVKSVPLNEDGWYLTGSAGYLRRPYTFRKAADLPVEEGELQKGSGAITLNIPIPFAGDRGSASPLEFRIGTSGQIFSRDGRQLDDGGLHKVTPYLGETTGLGYSDNGVGLRGDALAADLSLDLSHNLTDQIGDGTVSGRVKYTMPLLGYVNLETSLWAGKRLPVYGGPLPPERLFSPLDIPLVDFGRNLGDPYAADSFWYSGLFFVLAQNQYLQPMVGATVSSDGRGGTHEGAGFALRVPLVGLTIYLGRDQEGRLTWGLGANRRWEF